MTTNTAITTVNHQHIAMLQRNPAEAKQLISQMSVWLAEQFPDSPIALEVAAVNDLIDRLDSLRLQACDEINYYRDLVIEVEHQRDRLAYEIDTRNSDDRGRALREITHDIAITLNLNGLQVERLLEALRGEHSDLLGRFTMADVEDFAVNLVEQVADSLVPEDFDNVD